MKQFSGHASILMPAAPHAVFDVLTDVARLPEWNAAIESVVDDPGPLQPDSRWTVRMHPRHTPRWGSRSHVQVLDREQLRFAYDTHNTDGNPSWVDWSWTVTDTPDGAAVTVDWTCHLQTFDRRYFAGPMRKRQLAREVPRSLASLAERLATAPAA